MDSWVSEFNDLSRLADEIHAGVQQRNRAPHNSSATSTLQATLRKKMSQLTLRIATLDDELYKVSQNPAEYHITAAEVRRREGLISALQARRDQLVTQLSSTGNVNAAHSGDANRTWNAVETDETRQLDTTAMLQRLERREADQDEKIDAIGRAAGRLSAIALDISDELQDQDQVIDELDSRTDLTTRKVKVETARATSLKEKAATGSLWLCIALLAIVIVLLLVL